MLVTCFVFVLKIDRLFLAMTTTTIPGVGMEFNSVDEAWEFWVEYGKKIGFGVRKDYFNKRKKDSSIR